MLNSRTKILLYAGIAIVTVAVLATVIGNVSFNPGDPAFFRQFLNFGFRTGSTEIGQTSLPLGSILTIIIIATAVLLVVVLIFFPRLRREFIKRLAIALVTALLILFVASRILMNTEVPEADEELRNRLLGDFTEDASGIPAGQTEDYEPEPSQALVIVTSVVLVVGALVGLFFLVRKLREGKRDAPPLAELSQKAQDAVDRVEAGHNFRNTVIRCYVEMSEIAAKHRGVKRREDMTPREFESVLIEAGFPDQAIDDFTVLFERVRYGAEDLPPADEQQALECLRVVSQSCGGIQ